MWDTGYEMKISSPVHVRNVLILTRKCDINLTLRSLRDGMRDEKQQIRPTKRLNIYLGNPDETHEHEVLKWLPSRAPTFCF